MDVHCRDSSCVGCSYLSQSEAYEELKDQANAVWAFTQFQLLRFDAVDAPTTKSSPPEGNMELSNSANLHSKSTRSRRNIDAPVIHVGSGPSIGLPGTIASPAFVVTTEDDSQVRRVNPVRPSSSPSHK